MKQIHIGEIIKQKRLELSLTQEELCEGICEPATISRIESGRQNPSRSKLNALLQRLGLPDDKYYAMMSENEMQIEQLKNEIISFNSRKLYAEALQKIDSLTLLADEDDTLTKQFIIRSKVLNGKMENGQIVPYTMEEKLELLHEAIRLTVPNFSIDSIGSRWYSLDELKIINQIAISYAEEKHYEETAEVFRPLMEYLQKKFVINAGTSTMAILVASNYSNLLSILERHEEAQEVAQWGYDQSLEWGRSGALGTLLFVIAESLYHKGQIEESKDYFMQSYYVYRAMKNYPDMEIMKRNIKNNFNIDV